MRGKKKSDKEIDGMIKLAREVQQSVLQKGLEPGHHPIQSRTLEHTDDSIQS